MPTAAGPAVALLSCVALLGAALRVLAPVCPRGGLRVLAAVPVAVATAVVHALALGLVGAGGSVIALGLAAGVTWLAAWRWLPPSGSRLGDLAPATAARAAAAGAAVGVVGATAAWAVWQPHPRGDSLKYHLPETVRWAAQGRPGSVHHYVLTFDVGWYPVTHEVVLAWLLATSSGFVLPAVWGAALLALTGAAGWIGSRALGAGAAGAGLTTAVLVTLPAAALQAGTMKNDLAAYAFFTCGAALLAAARDRPQLLPFGALALALSAGIKSTGLVLGVGLLVVALVRHRNRLRALAGPLLVVAAASVVVGGFWYLRNLAVHGSPFWPLVTTPWGDPVAPAVTLYGGRFLDDPVGLAREHGLTYLAALGGGTVLLLAALCAPLARRRRTAALLAAATAISLLVWGSAAFSGLPPDPALAQNPVFADIAAGTTRYLLPALAVATLALAAAPTRRLRLAAATVLLSALLWNVQRLLSAGQPELAPLPWLAAGAVGGALAAALAAVAPAGRPRVNLPAAVPVVGLALLLAAGAAAATDGFWTRHARLDAYQSASVVRWLAAQDTYRTGRHPVSSTHFTFAPFAGDDGRHPLLLVPRDAPCADVEARRRTGWLVLTRDPETPVQDDPTARGCLAGVAPDYDDESWRVYAPAAP